MEEADVKKELPKAVLSDIPQEQKIPSDNHTFTFYQVKKQETLYGISKQFNVTAEDILNANPGFDGLKEGMSLKIPTYKPQDQIVPKETTILPTTKTESTPLKEIIVSTGETLYSIGKLHNIKVDDIIDWNPQLKDGLKAGMVLQLSKPIAGKAIEMDLKPNPTFTKPVPSGECYKAENINKTYKIALLLPFLLNDASEALEATSDKSPSDFENFNYFQFYAGFMLAADSLSKVGLNARVQVIDAEKLNDSIMIKQALRKPGMDKMDMIIGPLYASSFSIAARFAEKNKIGIVNPLSRRENIVEGNPYVIKPQVSDAGIASKLSSFILSNHPNANIIVVRSNAKENKELVINFLTTIKAEIANQSFNGSLQETTYSTDYMAGVTKKMKQGKQNIVILFSSSRTMVQNFVPLLNPASKSNDIILIGMDGWDELEIETEFLVNLNYHQITSNYIDYESEPVKMFEAQFRKKYGATPQAINHAFLGFDIGWYFLTSLMWYGDEYLSCLPQHSANGLQYDFNFSHKKAGDGLQNQEIHLIKLQDYKLVKIEN